VRRCATLLTVAAAVAAAGCGGTKTVRPSCPVRTDPGAYLTSITPADGPPGTRVTVSGHLPVTDTSGRDVGQTATAVDVYWNLDFAKWWSVLGRSPQPLASVAGAPVRHLGRQDVARRCTYRVRVEIPSVHPGIYPIEALFGTVKSRASFVPIRFQVVGG
jgi:hypothetical protein